MTRHRSIQRLSGIQNLSRQENSKELELYGVFSAQLACRRGLHGGLSEALDLPAPRLTTSTSWSPVHGMRAAIADP
jgi:hypothetical protein